MNEIFPFIAFYKTDSVFQGPQWIGQRHSLDDGELPEPEL